MILTTVHHAFLFLFYDIYEEKDVGTFLFYAFDGPQKRPGLTPT